MTSPPVGESCVPEQFDAIVLGAGISGLVAASILVRQGVARVLVADEYPHIGGNHLDFHIQGYTFDVGSLIFQDDSPLLGHFPELLPHYVPIEPTWGRLNPQGVVTRYPISVKDDLMDGGPVELARILASVAVSRLLRRRLANALDFAQYWIGERLLHRSGLRSYMERFYGLPADQIDIQFAEKRMGWIRDQALLRSHVRRMLRPPPEGLANQQLARPREGFAALYRIAAEQLEARGVTFRLAAGTQGLFKTDDGFRLETGAQSFAAPRVISTIPIDQIQKLCRLGPQQALPTAALISLFFSFSGSRGFDQSILYNFSNSGAWKRLTVYSDFYGQASGREFFGVEVNANAVCRTPEDAERDFRRHVAKNGLFAGDLRLEGSHVLSNAYPLYTRGADKQAASAIAALQAFGIESLGRQGRFDYHPTARQSTVAAEALLGFSF